MRTTLVIDNDVLVAAKARAREQKSSIGKVLSDLARQALENPAELPRYRNGIRLLPNRSGTPVTLDMVNRLRDGLAARDRCARQVTEDPG